MGLETFVGSLWTCLILNGDRRKQDRIHVLALYKLVAIETATVEWEIGFEHAISRRRSASFKRNAENIRDICGRETDVLGEVCQRGSSSIQRRRTSRLLLGPPSASSGSSYTRMGASPCLIADSKKSIPSSAGVLGVLALVGDEPADGAGEGRSLLLVWMTMVG